MRRRLGRSTRANQDVRWRGGLGEEGWVRVAVVHICMLDIDLASDAAYWNASPMPFNALAMPEPGGASFPASLKSYSYFSSN